MQNYTDIDYESFPVADLFLDLHWIQLPAARLAEQRAAREAAAERELAATLPNDHKVILVPSDPLYSPREAELWPIITQTVQQCLMRHPAVHSEVTAALRRVQEEHRGFTNPRPASLKLPQNKK